MQINIIFTPEETRKFYIIVKQFLLIVIIWLLNNPVNL